MTIVFFIIDFLEIKDIKLFIFINIMKKFDPFRDGEKFTTIGFGGGGISVDGEMLQNSKKSPKLLNYAKNAAKIAGTGALLYGIYNLPFVNNAFASIGNEVLNNINFVGNSVIDNAYNFRDGIYQVGNNISKTVYDIKDGLYQVGSDISKATYNTLDEITKFRRKSE